MKAKASSLAVILKISEGDFDRGFPFSLDILDNGRRIASFSDRLPPAPELTTIYSDWRQWYEKLGQSFMITLPTTQVTHVKVFDECLLLSKQLETAMNDWLNHSSLRSIERQLLQVMPQAEGLKFFIQTSQLELKRLPWQLWNLFEDCYPDAEIILSTEYKPTTSQLKLPVKILAIEGDVSNTKAKLDLRPIEAIFGTLVTRLKQPTQDQLQKALWYGDWDIVIFVGHSRTEGASGVIALNTSEVLSLDGLHYAFQNSVRRGLKLAIFNSCDGVGIASKLADLKIPYTIVMREQVPDMVAQDFLETLLTVFSTGKSLQRSVHTARCKLSESHPQFPWATWLPVIYQNPGAIELRYPRSIPWRKRLASVSGVLALVSGLTLPYWQQFTPLSPDHQDYLRRKSLGENVLIKTVSEKQEGTLAFRQNQFKLAAEKFRQSLNLRPNDPEALIYYNNALLREKGYKTHRIAVTVPIGTNPNVAQEILRGAAQAQDSLNNPFGRQGLPIEIMIVNDDNDPNVVRNVAHKVAEDKTILAVLGHNASDASLAAAPIYNKAKIVMLTPTSFADKLSGSGEYTFRMVPSIVHIAKYLAEYARVKHPGQTIAVCADYGSVDNDSYKKRFVQILQSSTLGKSLKLVDLQCDMNQSGVDKEAKVAAMKQAGATVLMLAPHIDRIERAIPMMRAAKRENIALIGSSTFYTAQTLEMGRESLKGMVLAIPWMPQGESTPEQVAQGLWGGRITWRTAMAYDALQTLAAGLNRQPSRQELKEALQDPNFVVEGITGSIRFEIKDPQYQGDRLKTENLGALVEVRSVPSSVYGVDFVQIPTAKAAPKTITQATTSAVNVPSRDP